MKYLSELPLAIGSKVPLFVFIALLLVACTDDNSVPRNSSEVVDDVFSKQNQICEDPRPEMCTMDYRPVCGLDSKGNENTFSNGCSACSNKFILSYQSGACDEVQY